MSANILWLEKQAKKLRYDIVKMVGYNDVGHFGGSMSSADIVAALYFYKANIDSKDPKKKDRDRIIFSKGHAAIIQYVAFAELGYFDMDVLATLKDLGSILQGHPDFTKTPGIDAGTGSLGQGLSIAAGMAAAGKLDKLDYKVYCFMGDGEINEGQIWEAAQSACVHKLDNLIGILDKNGLSATGPTKEFYDISPLSEKWRSFGWDVIEINGHDMAQIIEALDNVDSKNGKPTIIIANTIKGKGISFAENNYVFHNGKMSKEQYEQALAAFSE